MKTTEYFKHTRERSDRAQIKDEWILEAISNPIKTLVQSDGRIKSGVELKVKKSIYV